MQKRDDGWRVLMHQVQVGEIDLSGAQLLGCDGVTAEMLADIWIGQFKGDMSVEAEVRLKAHELFLHDGNPFVSRPVRCSFNINSHVIDHPMIWRSVDQAVIDAALPDIQRMAKAGYGLRSFSGGQWISVEAWDDSAVAVIDAIRINVETIRTAPAIVLDMRGNGGGSSILGTEIAKLLMGDAFVEFRRNDLDICATTYRATRDNIAGARWLLGLNRGPEFSANVERSIASMEGALEAGEALDGPVRCASDTQPAYAAAEPDPLYDGQLVVITDEACFSSCLMVTETFKRLGAVHLGHSTMRGSRYMEVRGRNLPSRLGFFNTMQKAAIGITGFGPYQPDVAYPGPMDDNAALEAWVSEVVSNSMPLHATP